MNKWDRAFWIMFVLLELAVIAASIWYYTPIAVILGFAVIGAGFAKLGDHVFHRNIDSEIRDHKDTMEKIKKWLDSQHELTRAIKTVHERRFQSLDKKGADFDEKLEKSYRELAGKIIDLENKMNLVSRAILDRRLIDLAKKPQTPQVLVHDFEKVWEDIKKVAISSKSISTLSRDVRNIVKDVRDESIILVSELSKNERMVLKEEFGHFWEVFRRKKTLDFLKDIKDPKHLRSGSVIISLLARLPYVEHSLKPRMLYLMDTVTHPLGTLKERI